MDYFESEEFKEIVKSYEDAKERGSVCYMDTDDYIDVVDYYMRNRDFEGALEAAEDGLSLHHGESVLTGLKISALINLSDFDKAKDILSQINPEDNFDYYYFKAQLAIALDDNYEKADRFFRMWMEMEVDDIQAEHRKNDANQRLSEGYMHIIASLSELSMDNEGQRYIEKWVKEYEEKCAPIGNNETDLEIAHICHEEGLLELEERLYVEFLDTNPYLDKGWQYLASIQHLNGKIQDSINSASYALAIDPDDAYVLILRAHDYYCVENYQMALKDFLRYEQLTGDVTNGHLIAKCYIVLGKTSEGMNRLERECVRLSTTETPEDREAFAMEWGFIAQVYVEIKSLEKAYDATENALRLVPDSTEFLLQKGNIMLRQHKDSEAEYWYGKALETTSRKVRVLICIAGDFVMHNNMQTAVKYVKEASEMTDDPEYKSTFAYLTFLYSQLEDGDAFRDSLRQACQYTPDSIRELWKNELEGVPPEEYYNTLKDLVK